MSHGTSHFKYQYGKSHMIEFAANKRVAWQVRMSHVTYEWAMLHVNESWHTHHVIFEYGESRMNESCRKPTRQVTHMNESCHIHKWAMSHTGMSHGTYVNESCYTYEWVVPQTDASCHIWVSHVTHEWVTSHMNESRHIRDMNTVCSVGYTYYHTLWMYHHLWMHNMHSRCKRPIKATTFWMYYHT